MMNKPPGQGAPRGRRSGSPDTRAQILGVARARFFAHGYRGVTLRAIAAEAGVDVALISYFFGSKKGLFGAAMDLAGNPAEHMVRVVEGDLETLPERALTALLGLWSDADSGPPMRAFISGAVQDEAIGTVFREMMEREVLDRLGERLGGVDGHRRAVVFFSQMAGLIMTRYVLRVEPVASLPADEIVRLYRPSLRATLFEPLPRRGPRPPRAQAAAGLRNSR
jgi:AcrR family transcriptional regulator